MHFSRLLGDLPSNRDRCHRLFLHPACQPECVVLQYLNYARKQSDGDFWGSFYADVYAERRGRALQLQYLYRLWFNNVSDGRLVGYAQLCGRL